MSDFFVILGLKSSISSFSSLDLGLSLFFSLYFRVFVVDQRVLSSICCSVFYHQLVAMGNCIVDG